MHLQDGFVVLHVSHRAGPVSGAGPDAWLLAWSFEPLVILPALAAAALYWGGWETLARRMPDRFGPGRPIAFMVGLASIVVALSSPVDALSPLLLQAHMTQHLLLMMVAPPLLWLGAPVAPLLCGLPRSIRRTVITAMTRPWVRRLGHMLRDPRASWTVFVVAFWAWHVPDLYSLALRSDAWHHVEHACFFLTAMLFWQPVIRPWPARSSWPRWAMIPYLILADLQNSALAAILTFSDRVIYPAYEDVPRLWGLSALQDQQIAGVIMWVPGSLAFLLPVVWLAASALAAPGPGTMRAAVRLSSQAATAGRARRARRSTGRAGDGWPHFKSDASEGWTWVHRQRQ